ncbi:cell division protein FtsE [Bifidobacterium goeldii]|uniref:Cell division ATP-binding protein FtsE n=1 Tax=Bifidobacterium goeldii TaxID=2306975 RepID=A0A430FFN5_9BIFI|nr:cell division ATP-binding protein FtsE [Bifidobacterium goeldii]RSX51705.1 cell division protein FtsE [Bifidobacterium goeldii]
MALISLDHVSKVYPRGTRPALDDVNLHIDRGDFVFLVGASGSGKTTLLSLLLREEEATDGEIRVAGNDLRRLTNRQVPQYRRSIGFVFQDYKLLANKTVWQNVAFALEVIGTRRSAIKSLVPQVLQTVGLTGKEGNYPHELSGGEQQRVAIARAYVNHPQILLADEPTGNLDPTTSLGIMEVLDAINRTGTTIVMATHNEEIVNSMRKRVVELHSGKIVRDEAQGSYDSAEFFPDSEVASKAHQALSGVAADSSDEHERFRPKHAAVESVEVTTIEAKGEEGAVEGVRMVAQAVDGDVRNEGIARLAQSVHSGRTGRYGEAFQSVEDTLTWGKGLDLEQLARQEAEAAAQSQAEAATPDAQAEQSEAPAENHDSTENRDSATIDERKPADETGDAEELSEPVAASEPAAENAETTEAAETEAESASAMPPSPPMPPAPPAPPAAAKNEQQHSEHEATSTTTQEHQ